MQAPMKSPVVVYLDRGLPIEAFAKAMREIGYELRTAVDGSLLVVRQRVRSRQLGSLHKTPGPVEGRGE